MVQPLTLTRVATVGDYQYHHFNALTAGIALGSSDPKRLHAVTVNAAGSGITITIYDGQSTGGTVIAAITPVAGATYVYDVVASGGLFVVVAGTTAGDYTISFV